MKIQKSLVAFIFVLFASACSQTIEDPANPKVNREFDRSADIKGMIVEVNENKDQLFIQGNGFGLNEDGKGIIQLETEYYGVENFEKNQQVEIWVDALVQVVEGGLPIISHVAKINYSQKRRMN